MTDSTKSSLPNEDELIKVLEKRINSLFDNLIAIEYKVGRVAELKAILHTKYNVKFKVEVFPK